MRKYILPFVLALAVASPAAAQNECATYSALSRIATSMSMIIDNPRTARTQLNIDMLESELRFISAPRIAKELAGKVDTADMRVLSQQLTIAQEIVLAAKMGEVPLQRQRERPETQETLRQSRAILSNLTCYSESDATANTAGQTTPASADNDTAEPHVFSLLPQITLKTAFTYLFYLCDIAVL